MLAVCWCFALLFVYSFISDWFGGFLCGLCGVLCCLGFAVCVVVYYVACGGMLLIFCLLLLFVGVVFLFVLCLFVLFIWLTCVNSVVIYLFILLIMVSW